MIAKLVVVFLLVMGVLGMFGGWRTKTARRLRKMRDSAKLDAQKCPQCGRYSIGKGPCACKEEKR